MTSSATLTITFGRRFSDEISVAIEILSGVVAGCDEKHLSTGGAQHSQHFFLGDDVHILLPMKTTSDEGDAIRYRQTDKPNVQAFQRKGIKVSGK